MINRNYSASKNSGGNQQSNKEKEIEDFSKTFFLKTYQHFGNMFEADVPLDKIFEDINKFVKDKCGAITTTQIRNIYGKVVQIGNVTELKMLRPNLAYIAARQKTDNAKAIVQFLDKLIKDVKDENSLKSFKKVMETIVAYHKYHHNSK